MWNQSVVPCPVLTVASWSVYRFLKRQVRLSSIPISWRIFQFVMIHTIKGFGVVNKAEVDVFMELLLFRWSNGCWQFDLWFLCLFQARVQQYMNRELPDVQAGFRKGRGTRDQIANIHWIIEKARVPEKHLLLLYWLCQSPWMCGSPQTSGDGNTRAPDLPPEKSVCRSTSNS